MRDEARDMDTQQGRSLDGADPALDGMETAQAAPCARSIRGTRILYVDDEASLRKAVGRLLRGAGASCLLAGTHAEALAMAADQPAVDLAILDFHMSDGPVHKLLESLRVTRPALPVIGTSGADRQDAFARCGVTHFLAKPWEISELFHVLDEVLSQNPHFLPSVPLERRTAARRHAD